MSKQKLFILIMAVGLMAGTAGVLVRYKSMQKLGAPGIKTTPIAGSPRLDIYLPELVSDYTSRAIPTDTNLLIYMPQDTSFAQRHYLASDNFQLLLNIVLMGSDRTSIHKPEFCLRGSGWEIDGGVAEEGSVRVTLPHQYDLPISKLNIRRTYVAENGQHVTQKGIYVYWFVADGDMTAQHRTRMLHMSTELLKTGVLQRWAYVACLAVCHPGQEEATFERMKKFIAASAPKFQLTTGAPVASAASSETASR